MNNHTPLTGAPSIDGPRLSGGAVAPKASTVSIGAGNPARDPTGEAGAPNLSTPAKPYGNQPICPTCNRGALYSCICSAPEPDAMPVEDMMRIMPELFERSSFGMLPEGWNRVEL